MRFPYIILSILILVACASSPTGRSQLILIGDSQIAQMGIASFAQMKEKSPPVKNASATAYVSCISNVLLKAAGENPAAWEVQVFNDKSPNAFALPGRKIGVHTGMFAVAKTPAQLAAVIGHEIGHVQAKHGAERVSLNMASQLGQQAAAVGLQNNENSQLIMAAIGLGSQIGIMLPYSRTHESEADFIGLRLMAKAGFDPQQSIDLWNNMAKAGGGNPPEFLSTHPSGKTRIQKLSANMPEANALYQSVKAKGLEPQCKKS
jgi:predicted Zn-dependent protease